MQKIAKRPEVSTRVMKHAVEDQPDSPPMQFRTDFRQGSLGSQTTIHAKEICGVVTVSARFEHWSKQQGIRAYFVHVIDPTEKCAESIRRGSAQWISRRRPQASQRKQMVEDCVLLPAHFCTYCSV